MMSTKVVKFVTKVVHIGAKCGFIPYRSNGERSGLEFSESRWLWIRFCIQFGFILVYEVFLITRCIQIIALSGDEIKAMQKIRLFYMTCWFLSLNVNQVVILKNFGVHQYLFQNLLKVTTDFERKSKTGFFETLNETGFRVNKDCTTVVRIMGMCCLGCFFGAVTNSLSALTSPMAPRLLTSVFKDPKSVSFPTKLSIGLLHLYFNSYHYYLLAFNYTMLLSYVHGILNMILQTRYDGTSQWTLSPREFHKYYKILSALQNLFNSVFSPWTLIFEVIAIFVVVINIFQAAVYGNVRSLILAFVVFMAVLYIYENLGNVHEASQKMLATWDMVKSPKWFPKATPPLHVTIGSFFFADRSLVLTILSVIFVNATNLILAFRSEPESID